MALQFQPIEFEAETEHGVYWITANSDGYDAYFCGVDSLTYINVDPMEHDLRGHHSLTLDGAKWACELHYKRNFGEQRRTA